jgi:hypothetical protein
MTSQTKKFIEVSDIVGLRLECGSCGCSLLIETHREDGSINSLMTSGNDVLTKCPTCAHPWVQASQTRLYDSEIKELFRKIKDLRAVSKYYGCIVTLEIKDEAVKP